jgi:transcriptional regulator with XRE-family HTH domain
MPKQSSRDPREDPAALLGLELKRIREAAGFATQDALARALGFTRTVVGKAESGERVPTRDVFRPWLDACGVRGDVRGMLVRQYELVRNLSSPVREFEILCECRPWKIRRRTPASWSAGLP